MSDPAILELAERLLAGPVLFDQRVWQPVLDGLTPGQVIPFIRAALRAYGHRDKVVTLLARFGELPVEAVQFIRDGAEGCRLTCDDWYCLLRGAAMGTRKKTESIPYLSLALRPLRAMEMEWLVYQAIADLDCVAGWTLLTLQGNGEADPVLKSFIKTLLGAKQRREGR